MGLFLRSIASIILFFGYCTAHAAAEPCSQNLSPQERWSRPPFFIIVGNNTLKNGGHDLINHMVLNQDLLEVLGLLAKPESACILYQEQVKDDDRDFFKKNATQDDNILYCKASKSCFGAWAPTLSAYSCGYIGAPFQIFTKENRPLHDNLASTLVCAKSLQRPVIILCEGDSDSTEYLAAQIKDFAEPFIHSIIILNRDVYAKANGGTCELNYRAISHRVYHFYTRDWNACTNLSKRKYFPSNGTMNGFETSGSKIVNIFCAAGTGATDQIIDFSNIAAIKCINIPQLILLANRDFKLNFDLAAVTHLATPESSYATRRINLPLLFLRRDLKVAQQDAQRIEHADNTWEQWTSDAFTDTEMLEIREQLKREGIISDSSITPCFEGPECRCPFVGTSKHVQEFPSRKSLDYTSFFVPCPNNNGVYLVLFIRNTKLCLLRESFDLAFQNEQKLKPSYISHLGTNSSGTLEYAVVKFFIPTQVWQIFQDQKIDIIFRDQLLTAEKNLTIPRFHDNHTPTTEFVVFADVQKQRQNYPLHDEMAGSCMYRLAQTLQQNERNRHKAKREHYSPNALCLVVGDLVRSGYDLDSWFEVLSRLSNITSGLLPQNCSSLLSTAIGTHDFTYINPTANLLLEFHPQMPTYGHTFAFTRQEDQTLAALEPNSHVQRTHAYFDLGRIRFLHLPYTTEEEGSDWWAYTKSFGNPLCFDFSAIFEQFIRNLEIAAAARKREQIDFIIVFGHAPLATAPHYAHHHEGLFNSLLSAQPQTSCPEKHLLAQKLLAAMIEHGVDVYLSGHNHQYDCCRISTVGENNNQHFTGSFTAVTVGLGNEIRKTVPKFPPVPDTLEVQSNVYPKIIAKASIHSEKIISAHHKEEEALRYMFVGHLLPAYLKCKVKDNRLIGKLVSTGNTVLHRAFDIVARRVRCPEATPLVIANN